MSNLNASIDQLLRSGVQHHEANQLPQAEAFYRQILAQNANHPDALHLLGVLAGQVGRFDLAVELINRAIAIYPANASYHCNLGKFMMDHGRLDESIACYNRAIAISPNFYLAYNNLGNALKEKGRFDDAVASLEQSLRLAPNYAEAHNNLGVVHKDAGRIDQAIACYERALAINPSYPEAHNNLGNAYYDNGRMDLALPYYKRALELNPDYAVAHRNQLMGLYYHPDFDAAAIAAELRSWYLKYAAPLEKLAVPLLNDPSPDRKLRIGYVSADFRDHCSALFLDPLIRAHDREQFEIFCYAQIHIPDAFEKTFQTISDHWRPTLGLSDEQLAKQIRDDRIDILIDLKLHTIAHRLLTFAQKPAPIQATWLGYPGTTGLHTIDYRISDPYLDPPGMDESPYTEKTIRLPETFWSYDPLATEPHVTPLPASTAGHVMFGCLNNFCKTNATVFKLWAGVLAAVEGSRLTVLAPETSARDYVRANFKDAGVDPQRVEFMSRCLREDYLKTYQRIDIGLDTFPYNGHTTSLDSLWMGVPVVTLAGRTAVGRAGVSQLSNLGLKELIANEPDEYISIAAGLAVDLPRLAELRSTLRLRMKASPLMDTTRFTRNMENLYRTIWRKWCSDQKHP